MDIVVVITIIGGLVGIIAGVVQVIQYIQERREKISGLSRKKKMPQQNSFLGRGNTINRIQIAEISHADQNLGASESLLNSRENELKPSPRDRTEKELLMKRSHWTNAGFSIPPKEFSFTMTYFANQMEVLAQIKDKITALSQKIEAVKSNPVYGDFMADAVSLLDQLNVRANQIEEVLLFDEESEYGIAVKRALRRLFENSAQAKQSLKQSSVSGINHSSELKSAIIRLSIALSSVVVSIDELQKYISLLFKEKFPSQIKTLIEKPLRDNKVFILGIGHYYQETLGSEIDAPYTLITEQFLNEMYLKAIDEMKDAGLLDMFSQALHLASVLSYAVKQNKVDSEFFASAKKLGAILINIGHNIQ